MTKVHMFHLCSLGTVSCRAKASSANPSTSPDSSQTSPHSATSKLDICILPVLIPQDSKQSSKSHPIIAVTFPPYSLAALIACKLSSKLPHTSAPRPLPTNQPHRSRPVQLASHDSPLSRKQPNNSKVSCAQYIPLLKQVARLLHDPSFWCYQAVDDERVGKQCPSSLFAPWATSACSTRP